MSHTVFIKRCFRLSRSDIAYLRFILESYDGLAFVRTLDPKEAVVEIGHPALREKDADELLQALTAEIGLLELPEFPADKYPPV